MKNIPIRQLISKRQGKSTDDRFKIRRLEDILNGADLVHNLHRHDFYFILSLSKGFGAHEIDFTSYNVSDKSLFFIRPGQVHKLELNANCSGYMVEFHREFYHAKDKLSDHRLKKASNKNYCQPEPIRFSRISSLLDSMYHEWTTKEPGFQDIIRSNLDIFLIEYVRQSPVPDEIIQSRKSYTQDRYEEFLDLLDRDLTLHKQASHYTQLMNLSLYQLNEITKSSVGKTASELIIELVLLEARRYLLATHNQVKDIASILGYEDTSYFIRFFKKHTGFSPEAFRNNYQ